jgi:hypothetical protein
MEISSCAVRKALFNAYVLALFTCLFAILPLFSDRQQADLEHFTFTCIKRIRYCARWNGELVAFAVDERSLRDRCAAYWEKFFVQIVDTEESQLVVERAKPNS